MTSSNDYQDRTTLAVYSVLIELGQVLGTYIDRFVVIGGSVPWLLYPNAEPKHIGTLDVDLSVDAEALGDGEYANLIESLEAAGYERGKMGMRAFQLVRTVQLDSGQPIAVILDFLMPRNAQFVKNKPPLLAGFAVQRADGADIAMQSFVRHELKGTMPDGRQNSVSLRVASIPALLVMKGYALVGRSKAKDAYDIYYVVRQFEGGPEQLAEACRPLLTNEIAAKGYQNIASKFTHLNDFGPETVKRFLIESGGTEGRTDAQVLQDAFAQVRAWLRAIEML
jgi:hypothetical protein